MSVLHGLHVLLVEDESLVAMLAEDMLVELGCDVTVAMRLDKAVHHARHGRFDLAVLDVNLGKQRSYPVADALFDRGLRFLFATGYGSSGVDDPYRTVPVMQKPYRLAQMQDMLIHVLTCEARPQKGVSSGSLCTCRAASPSLRHFRADGLA